MMITPDMSDAMRWRDSIRFQIRYKKELDYLKKKWRGRWTSNPHKLRTIAYKRAKRKK